MRKNILIVLIILASISIINGADEFNSKIYITTESLFEDKIEQAMNLELEERYDDALTVYINILNKLDSTENEDDEAQQIFYMANLYKDVFEKRIIMGRFLSVKDYVLNKIAELPSDVRKRYELLISGKAEIIFQEAVLKNDKQMIFSVAENYYLSEKGATYLFYAGKLAFESGEFRLCTYYIEKMRDFWTKEFNDNAICILFLASSYIGTGDIFKFNEFKASALKEYKGLSVSINNKVYNDITELFSVDKLKEVILNDLKRKDIVLKWGGDSLQDNIQFDFDNFTGKNINVDTPNNNGNSSYNRYGRRVIIIRGGWRSYTQNESMNLLIPGFSNDKIVITNKNTVKTVDFSKRNANSSSSTIEFPESMYYPKNSYSPEDMQMDRIVVSGRYAYGIFEKSIQRNNSYYRYYGSSYTDATKILTCIDLEDNNKIVWWVPGHAEDLDIEKFNQLPIQFLMEIGIDNSIILNDNKIYAAGVYPGDQDKRFYILCFDATPDPKFGGRLLWKTKLATVSTAGWRSNYEGSKIPSFTLKYDSGFLYALTNKGIISCLDTATGNIKYINRYMRPKTISNPGFTPRFYGNEPVLQGLHWQYNPIIIYKGFIYFTPLDSQKLYVIKSQTGELVREFPFGSESVDDFLYLIGVSNDILHIQGKKRCYGLNLKIDNDPYSDSAQNYELFAYKTVPFDIFGVQEKTTGRGVLGKDYFYIPTRKGVIKFNAKNGLRVNELLNWKVDSNTAILGDLYLYKTSETQYLVSVNYDNMILMQVK